MWKKLASAQTNVQKIIKNLLFLKKSQICPSRRKLQLAPAVPVLLLELGGKALRVINIKFEDSPERFTTTANAPI